MPKILPTRGRSDEKWCCGCCSFRLLTEFPKHKNRTMGVGSWCKPCQHAYEGKIDVRKDRKVKRAQQRDLGYPWFWAEKLRRNDVACPPTFFAQKYVEDPNCRYCREPLKPTEVHVDHMIPRSRGGSDEIENLVVCCADCNRLKHTRTAEEFITFLPTYLVRFANKAEGSTQVSHRERLNEKAPTEQSEGGAIVRSHANSKHESTAEMAVPKLRAV